MRLTEAKHCVGTTEGPCPSPCRCCLCFCVGCVAYAGLFSALWHRITFGNACLVQADVYACVYLCDATLMFSSWLCFHIRTSSAFIQPCRNPRSLFWEDADSLAGVCFNHLLSFWALCFFCIALCGWFGASMCSHPHVHLHTYTYIYLCVACACTYLCA